MCNYIACRTHLRFLTGAYDRRRRRQWVLARLLRDVSLSRRRPSMSFVASRVFHHCVGAHAQCPDFMFPALQLMLALQSGVGLLGIVVHLRWGVGCRDFDVAATTLMAEMSRRLTASLRCLCNKNREPNICILCRRGEGVTAGRASLLSLLPHCRRPSAIEVHQHTTLPIDRVPGQAVAWRLCRPSVCSRSML